MVVWNSKYETGNKQVDSEHQEIFKRVQSVLDAAASNEDIKIEDTIDFLAGYTVDHFQHEERLMEESGYPETDLHKKQHEDFVQEVLALRERVKNEADQEKNSQDVMIVIVNWLIDHVLNSDCMMANHYRKWAAPPAAEN